MKRELEIKRLLILSLFWALLLVSVVQAKTGLGLSYGTISQPAKVGPLGAGVEWNEVHLNEQHRTELENNFTLILSHSISNEFAIESSFWIERYQLQNQYSWNVRLGLTAKKHVGIKTTKPYYGIYLAVEREGHSFYGRGENNEPVRPLADAPNVHFFLGPVLGAEHFIADQVSIGMEGGFIVAEFYAIRTGDVYDKPLFSYALCGSMALRFYF
ncbi:hypothetical protein K8I28_03850 [bacterium]|nr:hypothetical protein [bacterium]